LAVFIDLVVNVAKTTAGHKKEKNLFFFHFVLVGYGLMEKKQTQRKTLINR
jgi:hypothetical protein